MNERMNNEMPENTISERKGLHQYAAENPIGDLDVDRGARAGQEPPQQSSQLADGPVDTEVHEGQPQEA